MQLTRRMMESMSASFAVRELIQNDPVNFSVDEPNTYDNINLPDGYTKPSKEAYNEAFSRYLNIELVKELRTKRNTVLSTTDKYATTDYPHSNLAVQQEWLDYRQALRDLPSVTEDPANPVWPVRPDEVVAVVVEEETSNVVVE